VPVVRRVLERRGIVRFYDESRIEIETLKDDTEADEMTVLIHVTLDGGSGEVHRLGPITCCGQGGVSDEQWARDWTAALRRLMKNAAQRARQRSSTEEATLRRAEAKP
jgi:hypothetical protein